MTAGEDATIETTGRTPGCGCGAGITGAYWTQIGNGREEATAAEEALYDLVEPMPFASRKTVSRVMERPMVGNPRDSFRTLISSARAGAAVG